MSLTLPPADVSGLEPIHCTLDLLRDLHVFIEHVQERQVTRAVRGNDLTRADATRLTKLMVATEAQAKLVRSGTAQWVDFVNWVVRALGRVQYDTKGNYAGYSSNESSLQNNALVANKAKYREFARAPLAVSERRLRDLLVEDYQRGESYTPRNEFYSPCIIGRLDPFDGSGCAVGIMPDLNFAQIRRFLLGVLRALPPGAWYATADLVAYLKAQHPYFLIPKKPKVTGWPPTAERYSNFGEKIGNEWGRGAVMPEDAPDGFERVEGRYVERFLEYIPLLLGYVDVAYGDNPQPDLHPSRGVLRAFRVNHRLRPCLDGTLAEPRVTVQPNFEIYIESEVYPANLLHRLQPLGDLVKHDVVTILRLKRERVAAALAENERLDVAALLTRLGDRELPQNVLRELSEWTALAKKFTLYTGFAVLEGDQDLPAADRFTAELIAPGVRLVREPERLLAALEYAELAPMHIVHDSTALRLLPPGVRSAFPVHVPTPPKPLAKPAIELRRETTVTLHFPSNEVLERFRQALLEVRCSSEVNKTQRTITYAGRYDAQVAAVITALEAEYVISVQNLG